MLDSRMFTNDQVASLFGVGSIPPKNDEERYQFYTDVLPPICELFCDHLDLGILKGEFMDPSLYFEFDLDEKLMSDDRLTALTSAAGAPPLTRNEARARLNLPPKEGGDELITPLNVVAGGKPSPQVMPIQDPNKPAQDGSARNGASLNGQGKAQQFIPRRLAQFRRRDKRAERYTAALRKHFRHQEERAKSLKAAPRVDSEAQNKALYALLLAEMAAQVESEGEIASARLGLPGFDMNRVEPYIDTVALDEAKRINEDTMLALLEKPPSEVFKEAQNLRAPAAGQTYATKFSNFSHIEAGKQAPDASDRLKRWVVEDIEKSAHPEMNGQTVGLTEDFSNGKTHPPFEHPNCNCMVEII
jgi:hypothetical protein